MKKRIIAKVCIKNGAHVQSYAYERYSVIGSPKVSCDFLAKWGADEICILDIGANRNKTPIDYNMISSIAGHLNVPLCYGGGITTLSDAEKIISLGVDKILVNSLVRNNPYELNKIADKFGKQAIIISVDVIENAGQYFVFDYITRKQLKTNISDLKQILSSIQFGELLISFPKLDGTRAGLDRTVADMFDFFPHPIILSSGFKDKHDLAYFETTNSLSGLAIGNTLLHQEQSVWKIKYSSDDFSNFRGDSAVQNLSSNVDENCRLKKYSNEHLEEYIYKVIREEKI